MEQLKNGISGLPGWARVVLTLGISTVFALVLLGVFVGVIDSPVTETRAIVEENKGLLKEAEMGQQDQTRLLRAICRNTAASELSMLECDR